MIKRAGNNPAIDELLKPSLQAAGRAIAIYSTRASFFVAFFGGPLAIVLFTMLNSRLLQRLGKDALWLAVGAFVAIATMAAQVLLLDSANGQDSGWLTSQNMRIASRGIAFLLCGGYYLMHRTPHRSMQFLGLDSREPWAAGILCSMIGIGVSVALSTFLILGIKG